MEGEVSPGAVRSCPWLPLPQPGVQSCHGGTAGLGQEPHCEQGLLKERQVLCVALESFLKNLRGCEMEAVASLSHLGVTALRGKERGPGGEFPHSSVPFHPVCFLRQ